MHTDLVIHESEAHDLGSVREHGIWYVAAFELTRRAEIAGKTYIYRSVRQGKLYPDEMVKFSRMALIHFQQLAEARGIL